MKQEYSKKEIQILNDIGNIKAILDNVNYVSLWVETNEHMIYDVEIKEIRHSEILALKRVKLKIWSVFPNIDKTLSVKIIHEVKA